MRGKKHLRGTPLEKEFNSDVKMREEKNDVEM